VVAVRRVDQIIWSMELTMAWARASLSRSTASAARCSVTSVWTPTHSRTAPSAPRMGIAQTEKHPHAPPDAVLEQEHAALGDCGVPGVDRRLRIVGMHGGRPAVALVIVPALHLSFRQRDKTLVAPSRKREWLDHERGLDRHHAPFVIRPHPHL
jgi:hypothetical protein